MKEWIKNHEKLVNQILKFGVVGGLAFLIDYCLLFLLTEFLNIHYLISSVISFIISLIFNYILSIKWVFDVTKKQTIKEITIFTILSVIGLGINQVVMYLGSDILNIHYMITKLAATAIVMVWNFVTRKIFIEK
ncbi:MAG: GtrA family protein [Firmicutes bacterium]|nr:GtrA family protein [Bacillota bacterium]